MLKIALPLLVVGLFLSATFARANYGVDIGDTFTFDVIANERSITLGANSATADGYEIDGHAFAVGTSVEVEVLDFEVPNYSSTSIRNLIKHSPKSNTIIPMISLDVLSYIMKHKLYHKIGDK